MTPAHVQEWLTTLAPYFASLMAFAAILWTRNAIVNLRVHINSRMDSLLKLKGESEHAKGRLEGVAAEQDKQSIDKSIVPVDRGRDKQ